MGQISKKLFFALMGASKAGRVTRVKIPLEASWPLAFEIGEMRQSSGVQVCEIEKQIRDGSMTMRGIPILVKDV